jgi:hypothetical protein
VIVGNEARKKRLLDAIMRLPLVPGADIDGALDVLQLGTYFATVNDAPHMTSSRRKDGEVEELRRFVKLAERLRTHINSMHREAIGALSPKGVRHAFSVDWDLEAMIGRAEARIACGPTVAASTSPKRLAPEQVAQICAQLYTDLTGKRAAPHGDDYSGKKGGPYLRFLGEVYAALEMKGNPEHYGRDAEGVEIIGGNGGVAMRKTPRKTG